MISQFPVTFGKIAHVTHLFIFIHLFGSLIIFLFKKKFFSPYLDLFQGWPTSFHSFACPGLKPYCFDDCHFRMYLTVSRSSSPPWPSSTLCLPGQPRVFLCLQEGLDVAHTGGWLWGSPSGSCGSHTRGKNGALQTPPRSGPESDRV